MIAMSISEDNQATVVKEDENNRYCLERGMGARVSGLCGALVIF